MDRPIFVDEVIGRVITSEAKDTCNNPLLAEEAAAITRMRLPDIQVLHSDEEIAKHGGRIREALMHTLEQQRSLSSLRVLLESMPEDHYEVLFEKSFWFGAEDITPLFKAGQKDRLKRYGREDAMQAHDYTIEGVAFSAHLFHLLEETLPKELCDRFKSLVLQKIVPGWRAANTGPAADESDRALLEFFRSLSDGELAEFKRLNSALKNYAYRIGLLGTVETQRMYPPKEGEAGMEFLQLGRKDKNPELQHSVHAFGAAMRWYGRASSQVSKERESIK